VQLRSSEPKESIANMWERFYMLSARADRRCEIAASVTANFKHPETSANGGNHSVAMSKVVWCAIQRVTQKDPAGTSTACLMKSSV
jgi:hypothetical protein